MVVHPYKVFSPADVAEVMLGAGAVPNAQTSLASTPHLDKAEPLDHHAVSPAAPPRREDQRRPRRRLTPFGGYLDVSNPYDW